VPDGEVQESWRWLRDVMLAVGREEICAWQSLDDVIEALARALPVFAELPNLAPAADVRLAGQKVPRQPHRYSGRTAMLAHRTIHEPQPPMDADAPLAFSMEGYQGHPPPGLMPFVWAPGWNSPQAIHKLQSEVNGPLRGGDPGVRLLEPALDGHVAFFRQLPEAPAHRHGTWLFVPLYHLFGTEELSALAPAVAERVPTPYVALSSADAATLQVTAGDMVAFQLADVPYRLPVQVDTAMPSGVAGLPVGLPALQGIALPAWSAIAKVEQS
jgi:NADH-quinone oxidoreductase subunit G